MFQVPATHSPSLPATKASRELTPASGAFSRSRMAPQNSPTSIAAGSLSGDFFMSAVKTLVSFCHSRLWKAQT